MADSENSRTLPSNRYRNLLAATARLLSEIAVNKGGANGADTTEALTKWSTWSQAYSDYSRLCGVQQRLESELFRTAATEQRVPLPESASFAPSEPFERDAPAKALSSSEPEVGFRASQWDAVDDVAGHSRAKAAEDSASAREQLLAADLWSVSGKSAVSAMAKLHCLLEQGEPVPGSGEFPWPQIRSALADLLMASTPDTTTLPDLSERRSVARVS
jgi:hypothetical protein